MNYSSINEILKYDNILLKVIRFLSDQNSIILISGPSGSGKTTLAANIGKHWIDAGNEILNMQGERKERKTPYFSFYKLQRTQGLAPNIIERGVDRGTEFLKDIPLLGNTVSLLADLLVDTPRLKYSLRF